MDEIATAPFWIAIGKIAWIDLVLSGDNAVVIALAARRLPPKRQRQAIVLGSVGAIGLRVVLIYFAVAFLALPVVKLAGAFALIWIGVQLMAGDDRARDIDAAHTLAAAVRTILVADLVMSLDNVLALAAVAEAAVPAVRPAVLLVGLGLTVPLIMFGSTLVLALIRRFPILVAAGAALLGFIGGEMAAADPLLSRWGFDPAGWSAAAGIVGAASVLALGTIRRRASASDRGLP